MNPTAIDQALSGDRRIEPSAEFPTQVMRAIHAHTATRRRRSVRLDELWSLVTVASVVVPVVVAVRFLTAAGDSSGELAEAARWLSITLTGTLAGAWWCTRHA
jgi:hypothetical protein